MNEVEYVADIISPEENINNLMRKLVIEAKKMGKDYKSQLIENILDIWEEIDEEYEEEKNNNPNLTIAEIEFESRLIKFLEYYKKDILFTYVEHWNIFYGGCKSKESLTKEMASESELCNNYYKIILAMFSLFNNHCPINLDNINTFIKSTLNKSKVTSSSIGPLYDFFYKKLNFKSETDFPVFTECNNYQDNLMQCKQFQIYMEVFSKGFNRGKSFKTAIAAIWVINRYF